MPVVRKVSGIVNGHWEPSEPRFSVARTLQRIGISNALRKLWMFAKPVD